MGIFLFNALLKGIVEGVTEFLPISSTGHLILVREWFPLTADPARVRELDNLFDVVIQLPAILAVVLLYWKRLFNSVYGILSQRDSQRFWFSIFAAFLPAAIVGLLLENALEGMMRVPVVAIALVVGGVVILVIEKWGVAGAISRAEEVPVVRAFGIGLVQCLSMIPGTSRSGATIIGGRLLGLNRTAAAEFSFFLAMPTMFGAFALKFFKAFPQIQWATDGPVLLVGSVSAFVSAWVVVALFIKFVQRYSLSVFGWYRIALGLLILYS